MIRTRLFCCRVSYRTFLNLAFVCSLLLMAMPLHSMNHTYEVIAEEGDTIDGETLSNIQGNPALNNDGDVTFVGDYLNAGLKEGISTKTDLLVAEGDVIGGETITAITQGGSDHTFER